MKVLGHPLARLLLVLIALLSSVGIASGEVAAFTYDDGGNFEEATTGALSSSFVEFQVRSVPNEVEPVAARGAGPRLVSDFVAPNGTLDDFANWGDEISDGARMVDQPLRPPGFNQAITPDKLDHIFVPKHNLDPLVTNLGSREAVIEQMLIGIRGQTPASGVFEIPTVIGGQTVIVRGAVVDGVPRLGTAFTP